MERIIISKDREVFLGKVGGLVTPLVTPGRIDSRGKVKVDIVSYGKLLNQVIPHADIIFPSGFAGEGPDLQINQWSSLVKKTVDVRNKLKSGALVFPGILKKEPADIYAFSRKAKELGADGLVIAPMYGRNSKDDIYSLFELINQYIIIYTNPDLQDGKDMPLEFIKELVDKFPDKIVGIKCTSNDYEYFSEILKLRSDKFKVFQGNSKFDAKSLRDGANGVVPVESNLNPKEFKELVSDLTDPYKQHSLSLEDSIMEIIDKLKKYKSEHGYRTSEAMKVLLKEKGVISSSVMFSKTK